MELINCPFLQAEVELTSERKQHIADTHPELLPAYEKEFSVVVIISESFPIKRDWIITAYLHANSHMERLYGQKADF